MSAINHRGARENHDVMEFQEQILMELEKKHNDDANSMGAS